MPNPAPPPRKITWDQAIAFRLARHRLLERAAPGALAAVAGDMAGAQAQLHSAAQLSLRARIFGLQIAQVEQALHKRTLVKAACMRRTLFLVPAGELALFVRGSARRAAKEVRWARGKGVPARALDAAIEAALAVLDRPLTRPEVAERVSRALGVRTRSVHGGGWGSRRKLAAVAVGGLTYPVVDLLHLAGARGVVCHGPPAGGEPTFVRADAWVPKWRDLPPQEAEDGLLRRYLRAFGPATAADFAMWTGMTLTEAREIWNRGQAGLAAVEVEGWSAAVLGEDLEELAQAGFERPLVRLLPHFDSFLLGHRQRDHLVPAAHHARVYRPQGWVYPVVLVDGRAAGVWEQARQGDRLRVRVTGFGPFPRRAAAGVRQEARDLGRLLGCGPVDVHFE